MEKSSKNKMSDVSRLSEPYRIMYTLEEREYDEITKLASIICDTPISLITFFDENNQFFKSRHGLDITDTPLEYSFCRHVIADADRPMIISNAHEDERFSENPFVKGEGKIVFYAGYPIKTVEGVPFATLCVVDYKTKELSDNQKEALKSLSFQVEKLLELRRTKFDLETKNISIKQKNTTLKNIIEGTDAGTWELDVKSGEIFLNDKWLSLIHI